MSKDRDSVDVLKISTAITPETIEKTKAQIMASTPKEMAVAATGGLRDNKGKARLSLVPAELEEAVAQVIWNSSKDSGLGKYPLHNWKKGLPWSEVAESAMRHLKAFAQKGEDTDPESGLDHLAHAACNVAFLLWYRKHRQELDDRGGK